MTEKLFINEKEKKEIKWHLTDFGDHYSLATSKYWIALNIYKDGRGIQLVQQSDLRDFETDSDGYIKVIKE